RPAGSLPPSKPRTGPAPPRRAVGGRWPRGTQLPGGPPETESAGRPRYADSETGAPALAALPRARDRIDVGHPPRVKPLSGSPGGTYRPAPAQRVRRANRPRPRDPRWAGVSSARNWHGKPRTGCKTDSLDTHRGVGYPQKRLVFTHPADAPHRRIRF